MNCPVCFMAFDDVIQRPRTLPCGHTVCTPCLNGLKDQGQVMCPICRVVHAVPETGNFGISYIVEALIRRQREAASACPPARSGKDTGEPAPSPVTGPGRKGPASLSNKIRSLLQDQEAKVLAAIHTSQEVQAQLRQTQTSLAEWGDRQQDLEDRLQALMDRSKNARLQVLQEEARVTAKMEQVQEGEQQLHALLDTLRMVTTGLEAYKAIADADHRTEEERERTEECRAVVPDLHTVTTIRKVSVLLLQQVFFLQKNTQPTTL